MCCLPDVSTMQVDGQTKIGVICDPLDMLNFIKHDFAPMNARGNRAEMFERGLRPHEGGGPRCDLQLCCSPALPLVP